MTFEEWWEANWGRFLPGENLSALQTKLIVAECWNEAICAFAHELPESCAPGECEVIVKNFTAARLLARNIIPNT